MKLEIKQIKAENSNDIRTETARYEIQYGIHQYGTLETFCKAHRLNSRLVSRRLNNYLREHGSLDNITFADLNRKNAHRIIIDGRNYESIQELLNVNGVPGKQNRILFDNLKRKLLKSGSYTSTKDTQLIKLALQLIKETNK